MRISTSVLDVACGTGFLTQHLRGELVALDQSARMVGIAAARMPHARVLQGDVGQLPFGDGEFDIAGFLHAVWTIGYDGPIGVEVLNEYMRKWPLETAATEAFAKTDRVVSAAREKYLATRVHTQR